MRISVASFLCALAMAGSAAGAALPDGCAWHAASDPAFRPNTYLVCPAENGGTAVIGEPMGGLGGDEDFGADTFTKADAGDPGAMRVVGDFYQSWWKTMHTPDVSTAWYRRAADAGDAQAMVAMSKAYHYGHGAPKDAGEADIWLKKAQDRAMAANDTDAMAVIGLSPPKFPPDRDWGLTWYGRSAAGGNPHGMLLMAGFYEFGSDIDRAESLRWYRRLTDSSHSDLDLLVGSTYRRGLFPVTKDAGEAVRLYERADAHGESLGARFLGEMYAAGDGVARDMTRALRWYKRAAALGDADSMDALATIYRDGVGADPALAQHWATAAAARRTELAPPMMAVMIAPNPAP